MNTTAQEETMRVIWTEAQDRKLEEQIAHIRAAESEWVRGRGSEYVRNQIRWGRWELEGELYELRQRPRF